MIVEIERQELKQQLSAKVRTKEARKIPDHVRIGGTIRESGRGLREVAENTDIAEIGKAKLSAETRRRAEVGGWKGALTNQHRQECLCRKDQVN